VRTRPTAVVRLEGALALAHGRLSRSTARNGAGRRSDEMCSGRNVLVRDGARRNARSAQPSTDAVPTRVRSAVREGQTAPVQPFGGSPTPKGTPEKRGACRTPPGRSPLRILRPSTACERRPMSVSVPPSEGRGREPGARFRHPSSARCPAPASSP
jgi:hypothetical protein